jgi:transposase
MARPLVSDDLWTVVEPLLPPKPAHPQGGHPFTVSDRAALTGILFVLKTGIPWEDLPQEMGCGSGMTCWRRLRDWPKAGVWQRLHHELLNRLGAAGKIDWSRASVDASSVPAKGVKKGDLGPSTAGRTRPTAASRAPSTTSPVSAKGSRWRRCKPQPT